MYFAKVISFYQGVGTRTPPPPFFIFYILLLPQFLKK